MLFLNLSDSERSGNNSGCYNIFGQFDIAIIIIMYICISCFKLLFILDHIN